MFLELADELAQSLLRWGRTVWTGRAARIAVCMGEWGAGNKEELLFSESKPLIFKAKPDVRSLAL